MLSNPRRTLLSNSHPKTLKKVKKIPKACLESMRLRVTKKHQNKTKNNINTTKNTAKK
jgi:hypothetical protein